MKTKPKQSKCPMCKWKGTDLEQHILVDHIGDALETEMAAYEHGKEATAHYRRIFKKEP